MTVAETPTLTAATWLASVLGGDATLASLAPGGVFGRGYTTQAIRRLAPRWPAVVFRVEKRGQEVYAFDGSLAYAPLQCSIEVIDKSGDQTAAMAAAARVHALITHPEQSDTSGHVRSCLRREAIDRAEVADGGAQFQHAGGIYDLLILP